MEMKGVTREEAVLFLLSLQERIDLIVQHSPDEYNAVASGQMREYCARETHTLHVLQRPFPIIQPSVPYYPDTHNSLLDYNP